MQARRLGRKSMTSFSQRQLSVGIEHQLILETMAGVAFINESTGNIYDLWAGSGNDTAISVHACCRKCNLTYFIPTIFTISYLDSPEV